MEAFLTTSKMVVFVQENFTVNVTLKVYHPDGPLAGPPAGAGGLLTLNMGDGTLHNLSCPVDPDTSEPFTKCQLTFSHSYNTPSDRLIRVGYLGFGGGNNLAERKISVIERPSPSPHPIPDSPIRATTTAAIIEAITDVIYGLVIGLLVLMIIIGGYFVLTAGGKPEQINKGKQIIIYSIIGFAVLVLSRGILEIIYRILDVDIP